MKGSCALKEPHPFHFASLRKNYSGKLKAKVAVEVIKEQDTMLPTLSKKLNHYFEFAAIVSKASPDIGHKALETVKTSSIHGLGMPLESLFNQRECR